MALIRGTTPTITFTFAKIDISEIEVAYLFIKQNDKDVIYRTIQDASVDESSISWTLTQRETLNLKEGITASIICDWRTNQGLRGRSNVFTTTVESSGKNGVI